jgi:hypothetical protein
LTDAEFYRLTPRQFNLLAKRLIAEREHRELLAAYTTAAVINFSMHAPDEPVCPRDFMPSAAEDGGKLPDDQLSEEELERQTSFNLEVLIQATKMRRQAAERAKANA